MTPLAATEAERLLQCPFCGGAARIESTRDWHVLTGEHDEHCIFFDEDVMVVPALDEHRKTMTADWNRRASQQSVAQATAEPVEVIRQWKRKGSDKWSDCELEEFGFRKMDGFETRVLYAAPDRAPSTDSAAG